MNYTLLLNLYKDSPKFRTCQVLFLELLNFIMKTFEERIRHIRGTLTMEEFAVFIGATKQKVHNYESGKVKPGFDIFENIAKAGYNVNWLLTGEGEIYNETENSKAVEFVKEITKLKEKNENLKKVYVLETAKYIEHQSKLKNGVGKQQKYKPKQK
jgi:transcriptional regulator with XRE-family HTH domain